MNNLAYRNISYGVYIISTWDNGRPTGCVANSVMQITSEPATFAVSINCNNYTNQCINDCKRFGISILSEESDKTLIGTFGFQSGKDHDKFQDIEYDVKGFMPILKDSCSYICCEVIDVLETQTHTIFLGKVIDADVNSNQEAMTYAYYHKVVKGKSPKNAPTYIADAEEAVGLDAVSYVCGVCGYVYDGDVPFEELPEDYICPICKQPKSVFKN